MDKLRKKQLEAIQVVEERIKQWIEFERDYEILLERLNSLPKKLSANIMVPIGKVAYIPGQLYRTNEVLAFLGDNWFAERTAYQVCYIVEHRLQGIAS
ncbi:PREDICTED: unconventional prefoldin RPB5 interactor 1-like [Amphimedon queenslandica]|uniref:Uncharacterized protein n=2 Tax=Amphimedon queenslandica TaxID=400682 RepID=A0AAN0JYB8_AMPQE|nr:PREDICTED: unconventional prefoldin RPB5 interactor 1-like [Amphimedon queenslandica]|eukprot:XP_019862102.1 PREDICTED: unconventional prefoldin RPB5 interactor 1-like [Amphimedon queenslandica]